MTFSKRRLKHLVRRSTTKTEAADRPYVGLENIEGWTGRYLANEASEAAGEGLASTFERGDVLFGKLRPYLAKAWVADFAGRCTSEALVLRPAGCDARFVRYALTTRRFVDLVDASTYGAKMPRAEWDFIGNVLVSSPTLLEQRQIADFIDSKTAVIDELIAKKERLVALLAEKRQALITQLVTKGLDPSVPMKDSGIEWMGRIPADWRVVRLSYVAAVSNGTTPDRNELRYWDEGTIPWLASGQVNDYVVNEAREFVTSAALRETSLRLLPPHTIIVGMIGQGRTRGMAAITTIAATINQNTAGVVTGAALAPRFLLHVLTAAYHPLREFGRGGQQDALNCQILGEFRIPLPRLDEQHRVAAALDQEGGRYDTARAKLEVSIERLREYRQALITAAVTGQLDVTDERAVPPM